MIDHGRERRECEFALKSTIETVPLITRAMVNASRASKPLSYRKAQLGDAIAHTRRLLDELLLRQVRLGWQKDDAA